MVAVGSWGRLTAPEHVVRYLTDTRSLGADAAAGPGLPYGNGRSYGDVCLNPGGLLWITTRLDRFVAFDPATGRLTCEAGILLRDIQRTMAPRGWMLPVTPGTQLVTVGGAIANDVHGKNHHAAGSFGDHVEHLRLLRSDGTVIECGPARERDWFAATVGGMGLTGVVTEATLRLRRVPGAWIAAETLPFEGLDAFFRIADDSEAGWEHTVAWIDCVAPKNRGIFMRGNATAAPTGARPQAPGRALRMPFTPPFPLVNAATLRPFNAAYYHLRRRGAGSRVVHHETFSYPLDNLLDWNRVYGPRGFHQYQSVVPRATGRASTQAMLDAIARAGQGSFLAVLKTFGDRSPVGLMSFPRPGVTLALDFANRGPPTERLFVALDRIVRDAGGRLYPAKDARMPRDLFESSYPALARFVRFRDPGIGSAMSRRLMGT